MPFRTKTKEQMDEQSSENSNKTNVETHSEKKSDKTQNNRPVSDGVFWKLFDLRFSESEESIRQSEESIRQSEESIRQSDFSKHFWLLDSSDSSNSNADESYKDSKKSVCATDTKKPELNERLSCLSQIQDVPEDPDKNIVRCPVFKKHPGDLYEDKSPISKKRRRGWDFPDVPDNNKLPKRLRPNPEYLMSLLDVVTEGTWVRIHRSENVQIICDRCRRTNLVTYINHKETDLCLPCADQLLHSINDVWPSQLSNLN